MVHDRLRSSPGFASAAWVGPPTASAPHLGRLAYRSETRVDERGRLLLDFRVRDWLGVADPLAFEVVVVPAEAGGLLIVPVEDFAHRWEAITPMTPPLLIELCQRVRPELACLGELGRPLLDVVTVVERLAGDADVDVLAEPAFALDVLAAAGRTPTPRHRPSARLPPSARRRRSGPGRSAGACR